MKLIFIHGAGGSKEAWHYQTRYFKNAEALDLPGHPDGALVDSIPGYAEWLKGHIDEKNCREVILVGHSLGGGIVLQYGLTYPEGVKALILVGSGLRLRVHPFFLKALEEAVDDPSRFETFVDPSYERVDSELTKTLKRRALENGPKAMLNDMRACDKFDVMERAGDIKMPVLAICGTEDSMTPPKYSHFLADKLPNARVKIIEGGTHFVFAEKPDKVNRAIEEFIAGL